MSWEGLRADLRGGRSGPVHLYVCPYPSPSLDRGLGLVLLDARVLYRDLAHSLGLDLDLDLGLCGRRLFPDHLRAYLTLGDRQTRICHLEALGLHSSSALDFDGHRE